MKVKGWEKIYQTNINQNKVSFSISVSDKMNYRLKVLLGQRVFFIIIKWTFPGKYNSILVYTVSKYIKQKLSEIQGEIDECNRF